MLTPDSIGDASTVIHWNRVLPTTIARKGTQTRCATLTKASPGNPPSRRIAAAAFVVHSPVSSCPRLKTYAERSAGGSGDGVPTDMPAARDAVPGTIRGVHRRMPRISRSTDVPFPAPDMFSLVADIERYPRFLPWCRSATVHARTPTVVTASLEIARGPFRKSFTTRNRMMDPERIEIELVDGPFSHLDGHWSFDATAARCCKVGLEMRFEVSNRVLARVLAPLFEEISRTMVDAFCRRAHQVLDSR